MLFLVGITWEREQSTQHITINAKHWLFFCARQCMPSLSMQALSNIDIEGWYGCFQGPVPNWHSECGIHLCRFCLHLFLARHTMQYKWYYHLPNLWGYGLTLYAKSREWQLPSRLSMYRRTTCRIFTVFYIFLCLDLWFLYSSTCDCYRTVEFPNVVSMRFAIQCVEGVKKNSFIQRKCFWRKC
jgi:hypothetical protein